MATDRHIGGLIWDQWEIHQILRGGMGIVYIVYDRKEHVPYAIKTFQDEIFIRNAGIADRFTQEARIWINLDVHQNITTARRVFPIEDKPHLFLEYVSGGDLSAWIGTPRLTANLLQVLRFAIQFCDGMRHALAKGVTAHRDIKPANCLITENRILKVTDFGLAKMFDDIISGAAGEEMPTVDVSKLGLSHTGMAAGTPMYMAPEQFDDVKHVDVRADIYSFGVMLFEMVTGRLPFAGRSWRELKQQHQTQSLPALKTQDEELSEVVTRCLAKEAGERHADFGDLRGRLAEIYERLTGEDAPRPVVGAELDAEQWYDKGSSLDIGLNLTDDAAKCYDRAIEINPGHWQAWGAKAGALAKAGKHQEANACYDRALELNPHDPLTWYNKGCLLMKSLQTKEAIACFDRAVKLNPGSWWAWVNKGLVLKNAGRGEEALACFNRALEVFPGDERVWHNKAITLEELGRGEEAIDCYISVIEINPRNVQAWFNLGCQSALSGRMEEALTCFNRVLGIDPRHQGAWMNKANTLMELGRAREAISCYNRVLEIEPKDERVWYNKGLALEKVGLVKEALFSYDQVLEINPLNEQAWLDRGGALVKLGRAQDALASCDRALKINPRYARAWLNKGAMLVNSFNRYREALACFEQAHRLGHPQAAQAIAFCQQMLKQE
jgi:tetratricopeptide (TPR) repeat protein